MDKIVDIIGYEYLKSGGYITVKFSSGWITRRKFTNIIFEKNKTCALSGNIVKEGVTGIYFAIKKRGYTRYYLDQTTINKALSEDFDVQEEDDKQPYIVRALRRYLGDCRKDRQGMSKEERNIRDALLKIKWEQGKLGKKMAATNKLLELVSEEKF